MLYYCVASLVREYLGWSKFLREKMFVVIFICRNLFFRIAGKTAKIRTRKNVVPHGINKNEPCIVKGWQYTPKCEFPVTCSVPMRPGAQEATFRLVEMRDFKYLLCEWDKHSSLNDMKCHILELRNEERNAKKNISYPWGRLRRLQLDTGAAS